MRETNELTKREREIVALVAGECVNREIADKLFISERTVKNHMHNIYEKTGILGPLGSTGIKRVKLVNMFRDGLLTMSLLFIAVTVQAQSKTYRVISQPSGGDMTFCNGRVGATAMPVVYNCRWGPVSSDRPLIPRANRPGYYIVQVTLSSGQSVPEIFLVRVFPSNANNQVLKPPAEVVSAMPFETPLSFVAGKWLSMPLLTNVKE